MNNKAMIKRTKLLILNRRYQKHVVKMNRRFETVDSSVSLTVEGLNYRPYLDTKHQTIVFGAHTNKETFQYLQVPFADLAFGEKDDFIWFDNDIKV